MKVSRSVLITVIGTAIGYNLIRFWEFDIDPSSPSGYSPNLKNTTAYPAYSTVYCVFLYLMTHFLIPFLLLLSLNCHVVWTILQAHRKRADISRAEKGEHRTSIMMIVVILIFVVCNTLPLVLNFVENFVFPDFFRNTNTFLIAYSLNDLSNLLIALNSATSFIIYSIFSQRYRKYLKLTFMPCLPPCWQPEITRFNSTFLTTSKFTRHHSSLTQIERSTFRQSIRTTLSAEDGRTTALDTSGLLRTYSLKPNQREAGIKYRSGSTRAAMKNPCNLLLVPGNETAKLTSAWTGSDHCCPESENGSAITFNVPKLDLSKVYK